MKTVRIIGGGLAGLSLATGLAKRRVPVEVIEAGSYPRHRVCGEFISGVDNSTLEKLGIAADLHDAKLHTTGHWYRQGRKIMTTELPNPARSISRWRLDARLRQRVEALGGEVMTETRAARNPAEGTVLAAGRPPEKSRWLGLKCHVKGFRMESGLEMHLGSNGYVGLTPVEEDRFNICGLFQLQPSCRGKGSDRLMAYLDEGGHRELVERLKDSEIDESSFSGVSALSLGWQKKEIGAFVVGDAGSVIPPFTGNGMSMAFESALGSIEPLTAWSSGAESWSSATRRSMAIQHQLFRKRIRTSLAFQRALLDPRGQSVFEFLSSRNMVPFNTLLSLVR